MRYKEWRDKGLALDAAQHEAVRAANAVRGPADQAVREHSDSIQRHHLVKGGAADGGDVVVSLTTMFGGGRIRAAKPMSSQSEWETCSAVALRCMADMRESIDRWKAGEIDDLPPSTCDECGRPLPHPAQVRT